MLQHAALRAWERRLKAIFDRIDDDLEDRYGRLYPLHPSRPRRGRTSNKEQDGLFNVGASFSLGIGSSHGSGYVVEVRLSTLSSVDRDVRERIEEEVRRKLEEELEREFPDRTLRVERDGHLLKIHGDLSLGRR